MDISNNTMKTIDYFLRTTLQTTKQSTVIFTDTWGKARNEYDMNFSVFREFFDYFSILLNFVEFCEFI